MLCSGLECDECMRRRGYPEYLDPYYPDGNPSPEPHFFKACSWGSDLSFLRVGGISNHSPTPDVVVCKASAFNDDILRMLHFILRARIAAPWVIFVLALREGDLKKIKAIPVKLRNYFDGFFHFVATEIK